jgi:hypothetical protein
MFGRYRPDLRKSEFAEIFLAVRREARSRKLGGGYWVKNSV